LITSRVHAGETPASLVFRGIFEFLTSDKREAKFLRRYYTFILIPCLNPDGVVCGNYRSAISGVDLNRQWINPDPDYQPEIFAVKQTLKVFTE
jgi:murein tripeptide amidase MpaA